MQSAALGLIQSFPDQYHLKFFGNQLLSWLVSDLNRSDEQVPNFTESRARALLRASDLLDDPTRHIFERLTESEIAVRIAFFDLLQESELVESEGVSALAATSAVSDLHESPEDVPWQSLAIAAFAWKSGYALYQLDPASPPNAYSPAGQVLKRAAAFVRQQIQRSATERDKLGKQLAFTAQTGSEGPPTLDEMTASDIAAPLPPYYRPPIPVNYPEVARDMVHIDGEEGVDLTPISRGERITITVNDLAPEKQRSGQRAPIQITADQAGQQTTPTRVVTPNATVAPASSFADSVRKKFARNRESMKITKLRVNVQEYPDGPGLFGLQVRVTCKGIKSHVAGTTTREGTFVCELPVPEHSGLTYDVDVTWPRDLDGEIERKSITLNADRTEFALPFYRSLKPV
jgi:hypothetical protein